MRPNNPEYLFNTHRRWCSNHMGDAPVEGGKWVVTGKTRRWLCSTCLERKAQRMKEKFAENMPDIAANVYRNNDLLRKLKGRDK